MTPSIEIWTTALRLVRMTIRSAVVILMAGLFFPQLAAGLWLDADSARVAEELRAMFTLRATSPGSFRELIAPATSWASHLAVSLGSLFILFLCCYYGLVHLAVGAIRGDVSVGAAQAFILGCRRAIPGGVLAILVLLPLIALGQVLVAPAILVMALSLVLPVIMVAEKKNFLQATRDALTLRWTRPGGGPGWGTLVHLLFITALVYAVLALLGSFTILLIEGDQSLQVGNRLWVQTLPGLPFGPVYLLVTVIELGVLTLICGILPALTTALYFANRGQNVTAV